MTTPPRPPVVCLCGSTRFVDEFNDQRVKLTYDGQIVLSIEIVTTQTRADDPQHADPELKARLDQLHLRKIDLADYILVLNVGGYIGSSTQAEIRYAHATGKPVHYLESPSAAEPSGWYPDWNGDLRWWNGVWSQHVALPAECICGIGHRPVSVTTTVTAAVTTGCHDHDMAPDLGTTPAISPGPLAGVTTRPTD